MSKRPVAPSSQGCSQVGYEQVTARNLGSSTQEVWAAAFEMSREHLVKIGIRQLTRDRRAACTLDPRGGDNGVHFCRLGIITNRGIFSATIFS